MQGNNEKLEEILQYIRRHDPTWEKETLRYLAGKFFGFSEEDCNDLIKMKETFCGDGKKHVLGFLMNLSSLVDSHGYSAVSKVVATLKAET
jgi:hypothetical protein